MKKTAIILTLVLAFVLSITASATDYVLDFVSEGVNLEGAYTEAGGEYTLVLDKSPRAAVETLDGVEVQYKANGGWALMTVANSAKYTEAGLNGNGIKLRFDNGVEVSLIPTGSGWGSSLKPSYRVLSEKSYNDDQWHTVKFEKVSGNWSIKFDGDEVLDGTYTAAELNEYLDGAAYIGFSSNAFTDSYIVKSAEKKSQSPETADATVAAVITLGFAAAAVAVFTGKKH